MKFVIYITFTTKNISHEGVYCFQQSTEIITAIKQLQMVNYCIFKPVDESRRRIWLPTSLPVLLLLGIFSSLPHIFEERKVRVQGLNSNALDTNQCLVKDTWAERSLTDSKKMSFNSKTRFTFSI